MERLKKVVNEGRRFLVESIVGKVVTIVDLNDASKSDWGMDNTEYKKLLSHEGKKAKVDVLAVDNGKQQENYYDVTFVADGYELRALSAAHIKELQ